MLFDRVADRGEKTNVLAANQQIVQRLLLEMTAALAAARERAANFTVAGEQQLSAEESRLLESLGYVTAEAEPDGSATSSP